MHEGLVACRAVHFASAMLLFGVGAFRLYAGAGETAAALAAFDDRLRRLLTAAAVVALLSALAMLPCVTSMMAGSAAAFDRHTLSLVLLQTSFGRAWRWHLLIAALLAVGCALRPVGPAWRAGLAAMLLASLATVGHALDEPGALGIGHEANDAVHLLAGGLWLGGLVPLGMLAIEARRPEKPASLAMLQRALPRFSLAGYGAVAVIMATGLVNALLLVGSLDGLKHTPYGQLLSVKIMLFLLLLAVAVINRLIVAPRILSNNHPEGGAVVLSLTIAAEQMFGLAIIVVVSILGTLPPAMHQHVH